MSSPDYPKNDFSKETISELITASCNVSLGDMPTVDSSGSLDLGHVDRYRIIRELGAGGFGTVFLAKDTVAGNLVALKALPPEISAIPEELENVRNNFALVSKLHHPKVAVLLYLHQVLEADVAAQRLLKISSRSYLVVMEYVHGVTLSVWKKQFPDHRIPLDQALDICSQVADALDYAHSRDIIHRDIKPSNVMINEHNQVKLMDFGLAAEVRSSYSRVSKVNYDTSGTRPYMAPEQWAGKKQIAATDQYSLAVMFYEMVSGTVPFHSIFETGDALLMMNVVENREVDWLPELSRRQNKALMRGLEKDPRERYASCREMIMAISGGASGRAKRQGQSSNIFAKVAAILVLLMILMVLSGGAWYYLGIYKSTVKSPDEKGKSKKTPKVEVIGARQAALIKARADAAINKLDGLKLSFDKKQRKLYEEIKLNVESAKSLYSDLKEYKEAHAIFTSVISSCDKLVASEEKKQAALKVYKAYKADENVDDGAIKPDMKQSQLLADINALDKKLSDDVSAGNYDSIGAQINAIHQLRNQIRQRQVLKDSAVKIVTEIQNRVRSVDRLQFGKRRLVDLLTVQTMLKSMVDDLNNELYDKISLERKRKIDKLIANLHHGVSEYNQYVESGKSCLKRKEYSKAEVFFKKAQNANDLPGVVELIKQAVELNSLKNEYENLIASADAALKKQDWKTAKTDYKSALKLEQYTNSKRALAGIREAIAGEERDRLAALKAKYSGFIADGKEALKRQDWLIAIESFNKALAVQGYSADKAAFDGIAEARIGIERDRLQKLNSRFEAFMKDGNTALNKKDGMGAAKAFKQALAVEGYAGNAEALKRLKVAETEIEKIKFQSYMAQGDAAMQKKKLHEALNFYTKAKAVEGYAGNAEVLERLKVVETEIDKVRQTDLKIKFQSYMAQGDAAMQKKKLHEALNFYTKAKAVEGFGSNKAAEEGILLARKRILLEDAWKKDIAQCEKRLARTRLEYQRVQVELEKEQKKSPGSSKSIDLRRKVESAKRMVSKAEDDLEMIKTKFERENLYRSYLSEGKSSMTKQNWKAAVGFLEKALKVKGYENDNVARFNLEAAKEKLESLLAAEKLRKIKEDAMAKYCVTVEKVDKLSEECNRVQRKEANKKCREALALLIRFKEDKSFDIIDDDLKKNIENLKQIFAERVGPPEKPWKLPGFGMEFIYVAPGSFQMGSQNGDGDEKPVHKVSLSKGYWIGKYEVTNAEFLEFLRENPNAKGIYWGPLTCSIINKNGKIDLSGNLFGKSLRQPVVDVSWNAASEFCHWLTLRERKNGNLPGNYEFRLPTEAEWEYAARGGARSKGYSYSGSNEVKSIGWTSEDTVNSTNEVGKKKPNELGIYDMSGNAWEWCLDACSYRAGHVATGTYKDQMTDPFENTGRYRVLRGGSWYFAPSESRTTNRFRGGFGNIYNSLGFRIVMAPCIIGK